MCLKIRSERAKIPTYGVGPKEKNPMFFEKRVYQGSTGKVYPYPVIDKILDTKLEQAYNIITIENEYLEVQIMPEIGGRIYRAIDKTNDYDFVYYNQVMKPALVGLTGPWVSGGIEFNWPQHHRPNTFGPVEYWIDDAKDDIKTLWLSEIDRMYGTKVTTGISLRKGISRIEIKNELYNPTGEDQTFLWWANPAVAVHNNTQSIFPPDVNAVMDHGKRAVSRFPIASGEYYKQDYSAGVDISRYKNIPVPTSYMAYHSEFDFVGGYDWDQNAGILHVADHHISRGKKQWTWGCGDFGQAWDRNLTDENGPYIELMTGVFTDNQPDFTWLAPYSNKNFTQYFMPYKGVGEVKSATKDLVANLSVENRVAKVTVYASLPLPAVKISLFAKEERILDEVVCIDPNQLYENEQSISVPAHHLTLRVEAAGAENISYTPADPKLAAMPDPATAIGDPGEISNNEALYLAGLHLEQYRHATYEPDAYYLEGLKRDAGDIRINNAYGNRLLKRGQFGQALQCFQIAVDTATRHNPNPYSAEVFYNLGKAHELAGDDVKAYDAYYKACWDDAWKSSAYMKLAEITARRGLFSKGAEFALEAIYTGFKNVKARSVYAYLLRQIGDEATAIQTNQQTLEFDPLDFFALRELAKLGQGGYHAKYPDVLQVKAHNFMHLASIYADCGAYQEAIQVLDDYILSVNDPYPMVLYMKAYYLTLDKKNNTRHMSENGSSAWAYASAAKPDYCFPNMLGEYRALMKAIQVNPQDARAHYYLGCFLYDKRRHADAAGCWETSVLLDSAFPTVHRNLALYYANKCNDPVKALTELERAFSLNVADARVFLELMELHKAMGLSVQEQRKRFEDKLELVFERDDLVVSYVEILNADKDYQKALDIIMARRFHPWEGGEGKVPKQHIKARLNLARIAMGRQNYQTAIEHLQKATVYGPNFGEGKLPGSQENDIDYTLGLAYGQMGDRPEAVRCFERAATGIAEPTNALYYNDQPPHMIYYQGLALRELGRESEARGRFNRLIDYGEKHLFEQQTRDYFAVSMPDFRVFEVDINDQNKTHCYYMMALGYMGLYRETEAQAAFDSALEITANHFGVLEHMEMLGG